jgi:uncharacterized protein
MVPECLSCGRQPDPSTRRQNLHMAKSILALLLSVVPLTAFAQQQPTPPAEPTVIMTGEGTVQAVPDRAWVTISAESRASSAREAQKRNTDAMTPVIDKLKAAGIPADAIKTIGYDVQYEWDYVNNRRVGKGYVARNTIDVRIDTVDRVGEYLEIAAGSGATSLGGIRFDLKDRAKLEREALRLAVADARGKADAAAAGAGRAIDRIMRIDESGGYPGPIPVDRMMMREAAQGAVAGAPPPISAGQTEIRARVTITAVLK